MEGSAIQEFAKNSIQGFLVFRADEVLFANGALAALHGFKNPSDLAAGGLSALISPQERKRIAPYGRVSRKGKPLPRHLEFEALRRDGSPIWVAWFVTPMDWEGRAAMQATVVEISDRIQMEARLKESEEKFRSLFQHSLQGIGLYDDKQVLYCNRAMARMLGYRQEQEIIGRPILDFVVPEDRKRIRGYLKPALAGREAPSHFEFQTIHQDGQPRWLEARASLTTWEGRPVVLGTFFNITARKRTEEELLRKEMLLETILENLPVGLSVVDEELNRTVMNRRLGELYDFPPKLMKTWRCYEQVIRFNAERGEYGAGDVEQLVAERVALAKKFQPHQLVRRRPDGRYLEVRGNPIPGGGFITTYADVSELLDAQERLKKSEERYRGLMEQASDGIFLSDRKGKYVDVNSQGLEMTGYSREELLSLSMSDLTAPDERPGLPARVKNLKKRKQMLVERMLRRKDGTLFPAEISAKILANGDMLGIVRDVTERTRATEALAASERLLQTVFDAIPQPIAVKDTKGRLRKVNRAFTEHRPHPPETYLGQVVTAIPVESREMSALSALTDQEVLKNGKRVNIPEFQITLPSGEVRTQVGVKLPLPDEKGETAGIVVVIQDITRHRQTEQALRTSEQRLTDAIESLPGGFALFDAEDRLVVSNQHFKEIYPHHANTVALGVRFEEIVRIGVTRGVFPEANGREEEWIAERLHIHAHPTGPVEQQLQDGRWLRTEEMRTAEGGIVGLRTDITELKQAELAVRASERLLQTVFEATPVGVFVKDRESRFIMVNEAFSHLAGQPAAELLGKNNHELGAGSKEEIRARNERDRRVIETGERIENPEQTITMADGGVQWRHLVRVPLFGEDGEISGIVGMSMDITQRKQAEQAVRASERLMQTVFNAIPVGVSVKDRESRYMIVNETFSQMTGWPITEILGKGTGEIGRGTQEEIRLRVELDQQVVKTSAGMEIQETPITYPNGVMRWRHMVKAPLFGEDGEVAGVVSTLLDISERKQAEQALQKRERLLEAIFESIPMGVFVKDRESRFLMANQAFSQTIGLPIEDIIGKATGELGVGTEEVISHRLETDRQVLKTGMTIDSPETPIAREGKEVHWRHMVKVPLRDESGEIIGIIGTQWDITDRVRAKEALRESQQLLQTVFDAIPQSIAVKDREGRFLMVNPAFVETLGLQPEKYLGKAPADLVERPKELRDLFARSDLAVVETGGRVEIPEHTILNTAGQPLTRVGTKLPVWNKEGNISGIVAVFQDVTERVAAEEALRESRRLLQTVFDTTPVGVSVKDRQGRYVMVNRTFANFTGDEPEKMIGHTISELGHAAQAQLERIAERDERVMEKGERIESSDLPYTFPDGTVKWQRTTKAPLMDDSGHIIGLVAVRHDITELKQTEQAVLQTQKLESLGVLAGGVAHDFNNILVAILGNAGLALMCLPEGTPGREEIRQIEIAGERATELCRQMLNYSGRGRLAMESINLNKLVEEITNLLQISISKQIVLNYNLGKSNPTVTGDPGQIQQVLMNLVINASEAITDQSGVISMATGTIQGDSELAAGPFVGGEMLHPDRSYAFVEVSDTGAGMNGETLQRIFDPFFTTKFTGRGLGLAAVLGIVRAHGGAMHVSSEPGEGTTFRFLLPTTEPPPSAKSSQPAQQPWEGSGLVLVIDDEEPVRAVTARMLELAGFSLEMAGDGKSGVEKFRARQKDIVAILLDLTMPRQGGEETLAQLREIDPKVAVILMSGYDEHEMATRFEGKGANGFLQKPFSLDALIEKFRGVLS